jgi:membrane-associated phospholipid phosphatase
MTHLDRARAPATTGRCPFSRLFDQRALLVLVAGLAAGGVAGLADAAREREGLSRLDPATAADVLRLRTPGLTDLAQAFTFAGSEVVVGGLAVLVLVALMVRRRFAPAATFALGIGGSAFLTVAVKLLVARKRPGAADRLGALDTSYSFPSGHTLNSAVFLALVVWLLWPAARYAAQVALVAGGAVMAVGVGASRVYLGYHWLTDVLASALVAIGWLSVVWLLRAPLARIVVRVAP